MQSKRCASALFLGFCCYACLFAEDGASKTAAIRGQGMAENHAYSFLEGLCDQIGGRVTGSPGARQAIS
jgi:hypothetical protein